MASGAFGSRAASAFAVTVGAKVWKKGISVMLARMKRAKTVMTDALKERMWGTRRVICIRFRLHVADRSGQRLRRRSRRKGCRGLGARMVETIARERIIETVDRMGWIAIRLLSPDEFYAT